MVTRNRFAVTADEFEAGYAQRSGITVARLHEWGRYAEPCSCGDASCEGWAMGYPWEDAIMENMMRTRVIDPQGISDVVKLARVLRHLHQVLEPAATEVWFHTPIPALGGVTPAEAILLGRLDDLVTLTDSYLDPTFQ